MSEESTTTIKFGTEPWLVIRGTVGQQKTQIIEAFGMDKEHYRGKTLVEVAVDADMIAEALRRGARKAAKEGYRPPSVVAVPDAPEPEVKEPDENVGPFGVAALIKTASSEAELKSLYDNNKDQWNDELTQLAKERKQELGIG